MLAYYDTFSGLLPCKVISFQNNHNLPGDYPANSDCLVTVKLTANRAAYKRGEVFETSMLHIIPRNKILRSVGGHYRIKSYTVSDFSTALYSIPETKKD